MARFEGANLVIYRLELTFQSPSCSLSIELKSI